MYLYKSDSQGFFTTIQTIYLKKLWYIIAHFIFVITFKSNFSSFT